MKGQEFIGETGRWEFNENTAMVFEDMLERSIPNYRDMRNLTFDIAKNFLENNDAKILDIGCSDGLSLQRFVDYSLDNLHCKYNFLGIDHSEPMVKKAKERFRGIDNVQIQNVDMRYTFPKGNDFQVITSILTMQFVPLEYRQQIIRNVYNSLKSGGVFLFVEKVLAEDYKLDRLFVKEYYNVKNKNGYSYEEIGKKKEALEGVLVPLTDTWNKDLLKQAGFKTYDTYWRYLNFEGMIAIKE